MLTQSLKFKTGWVGGLALGSSVDGIILHMYIPMCTCVYISELGHILIFAIQLGVRMASDGRLYMPMGKQYAICWISQSKG